MFLDVASEKKTTLSVSQLNRKAKSLVEPNLSNVWVEGEVSNFVRAGSGHWYFTLKDDRAQIRCAMFKGKNNRIKFQPKNGDQLVVRANASIYEGRGDFQLIVEFMEEAGAGLLQKQFERLKQSLHVQGLFDESEKKPLPVFPLNIAVITSPSGAAIKDFLSVAERRFPMGKISIIPSLVQGENAHKELINGLAIATAARVPFDLIVLTRGGGSIEDLWAFNNEQLAHAIFNCKTPVVSAVGHEIDFTIADFVADVRAPTPSAAAEIIFPELSDTLSQFYAYDDILQQQISIKIRQLKQQVLLKQAQLKHPQDLINTASQTLDMRKGQLIHGLHDQLHKKSKAFTALSHQLNTNNPKSAIKHAQQRQVDLSQRLAKAAQGHIVQTREWFTRQAALLHSVSPLAVLSRGYSISTANKQPILSINDVNIDDTMSTQISDGTITSKVIMKAKK